MSRTARRERKTGRSRAAAAAARGRDGATRERLLEAATGLFAEQGFKRVTVRQISHEAGANIAAVNYHFGGKQGLYRAIVDSVIATMKRTNEAAFAAGRGGTPEEQLRAFVRVWLAEVTGSPRHFWIHRLMTRELEDSTGALGRIFEEVIQPRNAYLARVVAAIAGLDERDIRVLRALGSIQGQLLAFARPLPQEAPSAWKAVARDIGATAEHIAAFSLAGIKALAVPRG